MRLSLYEIETIVKLKNKYFGNTSKIYLFGSRVDDAKKGGDIDLYVEADELSSTFTKKSDFLLELKSIIGEQKIDLIFARDEKRLIEQEAKEGIELDIDRIKLQKYFNECDKHLQRIEEAYSDIKSSLPLSVEKYKILSKDEVQDIDQYLYRFSKLQDKLGQKIFRVVLSMYEPSFENIPFLDLLHKLEKLDFLENTKEWINLRDKRNKIAHQYDDEAYEMTQAINDIFNQKDILKAVYVKFKKQSELLLKIK
ncbi:MAG: nucleotidyltransferase domain-containing protein [Candidatus Gracilibacteria bacterium]